MSRDSRFNGTPPPQRRRSPPLPPQDTRRPVPPAASGIQIRGLARDLDDQRERQEYRPSPDPRDSIRDRGSYDDPRDHDRRRYRSYTPSRSRSRSHSRHDRRYHDRDRPYRSPDRSPHKRSPSPRRRPKSPSFGGPPSRELMLDGLPPDITEDDLRHKHWPATAVATTKQITSELKAYHVDNLEDVRIIRNRSTGTSRQFGFIRFPTIEESKSFLERNHPSIYLYGSDTRNSQAKAVRIAFSRERGERDKDKDRDKTGSKSDNDWICSSCSMLNYSRRVECLRCKLSRAESEEMSRTDPANSADLANTGDSDVAADGAPSQFLLFRPLELSVTEEVLAKGAAKLLRTDEDSSTPAAKTPSSKIVSTSTVAHAGARPDCIRRVLLIRDRRTKESWRYGFVEFAAVEDAQAALAKFNSLDKFTIASKSVMVSYIHAGVFVPVVKPRDHRVTFRASTNPDVKLAYWDQDASVSVLVISDNVNQPAAASDDKPESTPAKTAKEGDAKTKKRKADPGAPGGSTKKMASHLQFWTDRHNELHGIDSATPTAEADPTSQASASDLTATPTPASRRDGPTITTPTTTTTPAHASAHQQSYADPVKTCCYLCSRQFKTAAEINKHERLSALHKKNLQDAALVAKAAARLEKAGLPSTNTPVATPASEYRDRAKERRHAFNQPKQPGFSPQKPGHPTADPQTAGSSGAAENASAATTASASVADSMEDAAARTKSKGASMLASMGYVEGRGLGAGGTGIQAPIAQDMYREGVGLGAEGGRVGDAVEEAGRATRADYGEFAEKTREKARERFQKLE